MAALCSVLLSGWSLNNHGCVRNDRTELFSATDPGPVQPLKQNRAAELTLDCVVEDKIYPESVCCSPSSGFVEASVLVCSPSKQQRVSVSSEDTESGRSSPDPQPHSPKHQHNRRSWPGAPHSVDICEGLEEWSGGQDAFHPSDTEEEVLVTLSPGRYRALADCLQNGPDSIPIKCGDVVQLQCEDNRGRWFVKNLSRRQEGFIGAASLHQILADSSRGHNSRLGDPGTRKARKLSSP